MSLELLSMGKYTVYVWSSIGIVCFILGSYGFSIHREAKRVRKLLLQKNNRAT